MHANYGNLNCLKVEEISILRVEFIERCVNGCSFFRTKFLNWTYTWIDLYSSWETKTVASNRQLLNIWKTLTRCAKSAGQHPQIHLLSALPSLIHPRFQSIEKKSNEERESNRHLIVLQVWIISSIRIAIRGTIEEPWISLPHQQLPGY